MRDERNDLYDDIYGTIAGHYRINMEVLCSTPYFLLFMLVELHRMPNEKPNVENTLLPDEMFLFFFLGCIIFSYTNMYCHYILLFYWTLTVYLVPLGNQVEATKNWNEALEPPGVGTWF